MKRRPRYQIRQNRVLTELMRKYGINIVSNYYCVDNKELCVVFEGYTWREVLNWINSDTNHH